MTFFKKENDDILVISCPILNGFHHYTRNDPVIITGTRYLGKNKTKISGRLGDLINSHPVDRKQAFF